MYYFFISLKLIQIYKKTQELHTIYQKITIFEESYKA